MRHLDYISQFTSNIQHVRGIDNVAADALSRIETNAFLSGQPPSVDYAACYPYHSGYRSAITSPPIILLIYTRSRSYYPAQLTVSNSIVILQPVYKERPIIPLLWRRIVFDLLHRLSHPGIRATQKLLTSRFVWPGINADVDVRRWRRTCVQCQRAKIQRHIQAPLASFSTPDARFLKVPYYLKQRHISNCSVYSSACSLF